VPRFEGAPGQKLGAVRVAAMAGRFAIVGAACAALNWTIMYLGTVVIGIHYVAAALTTCLITIPLSYFFHRRVTFQVVSAWQGETPEFLRFVISQLVQFALGLCVLVILVEWGGLTPMWSTVAMTVLMFAYGFAVNSAWVFRILNFGFAYGERQRVIPQSVEFRMLQVSAFFRNHGGGIEAVADRIARELARGGMHVHWMAGGPPAERPDVVDCHLTVDQALSIDFVEHKLGLPSPIWSFGSLRRLWQAVKVCSTLHAHDFLYMPTLAAMCFAGILGKPVVLTQHIGRVAFKSPVTSSILRVLHRSVGWLAMRCANQVVFVGKPVMNYFERFASFRKPPLLIANGVDHAAYHPPSARSRDGGAFHCLFVGRFVEKKGLALLRQCMDLPGIRWTFVGWGPMSPCNWGPLPDHVEVHEELRAEQVIPFFQAADLLVLPSTGEGFPLVVQEALACGTPVLVSSEVAEAFPQIDPACVFSVELKGPDSVQALRKRLHTLARDPAILVQARQSAITLSRQWSWDRCVDQYRKVYRAVADMPTR
jgi:glycosyltransferase involved in cell wall biosynthesis/putative flippase GtrA